MKTPVARTPISRPGGSLRQTAALACLLLVAATYLLWQGSRQAAWLQRLQAEGSTPPPRSAASATGYLHDQRVFIAPHETGETYRWIVATESPTGLFGERERFNDAPEGRANLAPRLYTAWLRGLSTVLQAVGGKASVGSETLPLWEPIITQVLLLTLATCFMAVRFGSAAAATLAIFLAVWPLFSAQAPVGVLTPRAWALWLACFALAQNFRTRGPVGPRAAALASLATAGSLILDPAWGFPALLISAATSAVRIHFLGTAERPLGWATTGALVTTVAWFWDRTPLDVTIGELRYFHPLYALAWLGLGLILWGFQHRTRRAPGSVGWGALALGLAALCPLLYLQIKHGLWGWLYLGAAIGRLHSLGENQFAANIVQWAQSAPPVEAIVLLLPLGVLLLVGGLSLTRPSVDGLGKAARWSQTILWTALLVLSCFRLRYAVIASALAIPAAFFLAERMADQKRTLLAAISAMLAGVVLCVLVRPRLFRVQVADEPLTAGDMTALVERQFSHWWVAQRGNAPGIVLTTPALSDSVMFHGGGAAVLSTAWETYEGRLAASRVLNSPDSTEAEAIMQSHGVTHLVLPSWDPVLMRLVQSTKNSSSEPLYFRLKRWVIPRFLRPIPYHVPASQGLENQTLIVFKVTTLQDEGLALSRLAEYFAEMGDAVLAKKTGEVLRRLHADDPNARIARAIVAANIKNEQALDAEMPAIEEDVARGLLESSWDRRVQRAIVLAVARHHVTAKKEAEACIADYSEENVQDLTPLQAHHFLKLIALYKLRLNEPAQEARLAQISAEYQTSSK